jgi:hypothetical protein
LLRGSWSFCLCFCLCTALCLWMYVCWTILTSLQWNWLDQVISCFWWWYWILLCSILFRIFASILNKDISL